jgi:hypothetical protein
MTQTPIHEVDRTVFIVDDDPAIRESLVSLLRSVGLKVTALASVPEFLSCPRPDGPACLGAPGAKTAYYVERMCSPPGIAKANTKNIGVESRFQRRSKLHKSEKLLGLPRGTTVNRSYPSFKSVDQYLRPMARVRHC